MWKDAIVLLISQLNINTPVDRFLAKQLGLQISENFLYKFRYYKLLDKLSPHPIVVEHHRGQLQYEIDTSSGCVLTLHCFRLQISFTNHCVFCCGKYDYPTSPIFIPLYKCSCPSFMQGNKSYVLLLLYVRDRPIDASPHFSHQVRRYFKM